MQIGDYSINDRLWKSLRIGQKGGVTEIFEYLASAGNNGSCLVSLPTGAGKTGIIATAAHFSTDKNVLVLCHRSAVKEQLIKQLTKDFFEERIGAEELPLKKVFSGLNQVGNFGIHISTFQKLSIVDEGAINKINKCVDLLIIDEGHSEPSPVWSKISRAIEGQKVIITATPYRNDLFKFDVDPEHSYIYTFKQALRDNALCSPKIEVSDQVKMVERIRELLTTQPDTKCIVKCKGRKEIEEYAVVLSGHFKTLAIHHQFLGEKREGFKSSVPSGLNASDYEVIIHQKKMDEGVDIPLAKVIVLTYPVASGRELVQTVGRIVRKSGNRSAYILDLSGGSNARLWENFLQFDEYISAPGAVSSFLKSLDTSALLKSYLESFPEISYFDSGYKKKFGFNDFDPAKSLVLPLASLCFINKRHSFAMESFVDSIYWKLVTNGELACIKRSCGFSIVASISFNNSRFLKDSLFFEPSLQIVVAREVGDLLAVYDSRGVNYSSEPDLGLGQAISLDQILALAARTNKLKTKSATSFAIGEAKNRPDGIAWRGKNLEDLHASQANAAYALSTLVVDNLTDLGESDTSYYLGVGSGRVSDQKKKNMSLSDLARWIDDIHKVLTAFGSSRSPLLNSFARPAAYSPVSLPSAMLLDLSSFESNLEFTDGVDSYRLVSDTHYLQYDPAKAFFEIICEGFKIELSLMYNIKTSAPELYSAQKIKLAGNVLHGCGKKFSSGTPFEEVLTCGILKILYQEGVSYVEGCYYRMRLPADSSIDVADSAIGKCLYGIDELQVEGLEEKGDSSSLTGNFFPFGSIFHQIDKMRNVSDATKTLAEHGPFYEHIADLDMLLCADLGTEPADFIVSSPRKIVYVHVKCGDAKNPRSSAGAIALVGSQAVKNLEALISPNDELLFANWNQLKSPWRTANEHPGCLERVRLIDGLTADQYIHKNGGSYNDIIDVLWDKLSQRRKSLVVDKEVWIIVGNAFSKNHFYEQIRLGHKCEGETLQSFQLIDSWLNTFSMNEVSLKLFVSKGEDLKKA